MDVQERAALLQNLAAGIARRRMTVPMRFVLDVVEPVSFLASQVALFAHPLIPIGRWRDYVCALEEETSWKVLSQLVDRRDS